MKQKEFRLLECVKIENKNILILFTHHMKPDPDAIGSQVGLKALLNHHFPEKTIKAVGWYEHLMDGRNGYCPRQTTKGALAIICDSESPSYR